MKGLSRQVYLDSAERTLAEARRQDEDTARKLRRFAAVQLLRAVGLDPSDICPLRAR